MISIIIRKLLRRKLFKGQFKLFLLFYKNKWLTKIKTLAYPINGKFKIYVDTNNFIDACIYYMGDYEPYLKKHFKQLIKENDTVLDVGANIGFHSLYFAELVGDNGKVLAFEPIEVNFKALQANIALNSYEQIISINKALGNENRMLSIHIDTDAHNPGAFNLMEDGIKNTNIDCVKGDDYLINNNIEKIDFIKVDVEGFELKVFKGLQETIKKFVPIIVFEFDENYQSKLNSDHRAVFHFLAQFPYTFFNIDGYGNKNKVDINNPSGCSEILALPCRN